MEDGLPLRELPSSKSIDVWKIALDTRPKPEWTVEGILSAEERDRASRFVFAKDADRFRLCRTMLRLGLAWYLRENPREIGLTTRWRGKPCLAKPSPLRFNVSHSKGLAAIAFATVGEVGIDLEAEGREVEVEEIAASYFAPSERAWIDSGRTEQERAGRFFQIWTRKEAVLKAAGCGFSLGTETFEVWPGSAALVRLNGASEEIAGTDWRVEGIALEDGFSAAVAAPPGDWTIRQWAFCDEDSICRLRPMFPEIA